MSQTETVKINFQDYNAHTAVGIATECLICGELICTESLYEMPTKICDKCKGAVVCMREQMENEEKEKK